MKITVSLLPRCGKAKPIDFHSLVLYSIYIHHMHSKQNSENLQKKEWLEADTRGIFRHGHNFSGEGARFPHSPDDHAKWETTEV